MGKLSKYIHIPQAVLLIVSAMLIADGINSQSLKEGNIIHQFKNASFEDIIFNSQEGVPLWTNCGPLEESPPTVHIGIEIFNVTHEAQSGDQYISVVARSHETWESFSQKLDRSILPGKSYAFNLYMAKAELKSQSIRSKGQTISFNEPIVLRVWGGQAECHLNELLFTSEPIDHEKWKEYSVQFEPEKEHEWIIFEAFYVVPSIMPYNGNILIDNLSDIRMIDD